MPKKKRALIRFSRDRGEEDRDQSAGEELRRQVGHPVIEAEERQPLQCHEAVLAPGQAHRAAGDAREDEYTDCGETEPINERDLRRDDAELEFDRVPGGAPDQHDDGVDDGARHSGEPKRIHMSNQ
jgi:hypothetical protein